MTDNTVTLAQLSDIHIGPMLRSPWRLLNAKRFLGTLNWYRARLREHLPEVAARMAADVVAQAASHIAVTGDMVNIGLPAEITRAADWLKRLGTPATVSVIPGNHDIYSTIDGRNIGAAALSPWGAYMASDADGAAYTEQNETFPFVRVVHRGRTRVALIALNSAIETKPFEAIGTLGGRQLLRLSRILDATRRDGLVRVIMLHHPPLVGGAKARHELTDAAALTEVLRAHGAELVIHGHNHRRSLTRLPSIHGDIPIVCVPSASIGIRTAKGEDLARAHYYLIEAAPQGDPKVAHITLVGRGLASPGGPIVELERLVL